MACVGWLQRVSRAPLACAGIAAVCPERDAALGPAPFPIWRNHRTDRERLKYGTLEHGSDLVGPKIAPMLPIVPTVFHDQPGGEVSSGAHALRVMDRAGRHSANDPVMPGNVTAVFSPPCAPELDGTERPWLPLGQRFRSHAPRNDGDAMADAVCRAWQRVTIERRKTVPLRRVDGAPTVPGPCDRCERDRGAGSGSAAGHAVSDHAAAGSRHRRPGRRFEPIAQSGSMLTSLPRRGTKMLWARRRP